MIEIKMPKDIRGYSEKLFLGLSLRQLIAALLTCGISVGMYFLCVGTPLEDWLFVLIVVPVAPVAVWGFLRPQGLSAEQYLTNVVQSMIVWPEKRYYGTENFYEDLVHEMEREKEEAIMSSKNVKKNKKK